MGGRHAPAHAGRYGVAVLRKRRLPAGAAPPPGAGSAAVCPRGLLFAIQYKLSRQEWMAKNQLVYTMQAARWRKVLGRTAPVMTPYESSLAAALEPESAPEPAQLKKTCWRCLQSSPCLTARCVKARAAPAATGLLGKAGYQSHAHPDDQDRPGDGGAFRRGGCHRQRSGGGQAPGKHYPEAARRAGSRLH